MKIFLLAALSLPMMAQNEGFQLHDMGKRQHVGADVEDSALGFFGPLTNVDYVIDNDPTANVKTLTIFAHEIDFYQEKNLKKSEALNVGYVQGLIKAFEAASYPGNPTKKIVFGYGALATTAPELVLLDGKSNNRMVSVNLWTFAARYSADLPNGIRNFGLRPAPDGGPSPEAWVAHSNIGTLFTVVNLDSGAIVGKVPTTLPGEPRGVVFSNSGNTAFEILDSGTPTPGGTFVVLDTAARTIKKTLAIPFAPEGILISPDGSTVYVIGPGAAGTKNILYYDLLSGTADLTVTVPNPDVFFGPYLIHPNGSRVYGQNGSQIFVFDPQARQVISKFKLGLAPGVFFQSMQLSPDGLRIHLLDNAASHGQPVNNIFVLDSVTGHNFGSLPIGGTASVFFVAPVVQ